MAASGTTKKITTNQLLGSGGTATLASATITGNLTAGGNVGFGTTSLTNVAGYTALKINNATNGAILDLAQGDAYKGRLVATASDFAFQTAGTIPIIMQVGGANSYRIDTAGVFNWYDGAGGTRMTLNATGLGVGASPSYQLHVAKSQSSQTTVYIDNQQNNAAASSALLLSAFGGQWNLSVPHSATFVNPLIFKFGSTEMMRIDASGNLLVGTTDTGSNSGIGIKSVYSSTAPYVSTVGSSTSASQYSYLLYSTGGTPAYKFYVSYSGQISATSGTVAALSDARFKENVQDIDVGLGAILALKPRKFDWKAGKGKDIKGDRGFIAQEFEQVFPNLIEEWADPAPEGEAPYKSVRQDLIPVLVKAIQELAAEVNALKNA
jgi:hypothetical protein